MARRKSLPRSPKIWAIVIALLAAVFLFGEDNPRFQDVVLRIVDVLLSDEPAGPQVSGVPRIIDGDTLEIDGQRIRLYGIDAPEARQQCRRAGHAWRCGEEAGRALDIAIGNRPLHCEERDTDRYGRSVAICLAGGENINAWMVRNGWAVAYRQYGGDLYDLDEAAAKAAQRGVWSGQFTMPWDWRKQNR